MASQSGDTSSSSQRKLFDIGELLRHTVTVSDRVTISQFLLDTERDIRECEIEMSRLKMAMYALEKKKKGLQKMMENCRSLLVPIHRLPQEILTLVFSFVCQSTKLVPSSVSPAMALSWVCGRWREALLECPSLWADIEISFHAWKDRFPGLERLTRVFMDRSKLHPLKLKLCFDEKGEYTRRSAITFGVLFANRARWQSVSLSDIPPNFSLPDGQDGAIVFPSLQVIELKSFDDVPTLKNLFRTCPVLQKLVLTTLTDTQLDLPRHQIQTLRIGPAYAQAGLDALARFTHLSSLELYLVGGGSLDSSYENHILSTPKTLNIYCVSQDELDTTLPYMTLPKITSLELESDIRRNKWSIWDTTSLTDFLARSACSITTFSLRRLPAKAEQLIALLELIPTLTSLDLDEDSSQVPFISSKLLQKLAIDTNGGWRSKSAFLPFLTHVGLRLKKKNLVEQDLFEIVASRWIPDPAQADEMGIACLRSLSVSLQGGGDGDSELSSLRCFRDVGLRLQVSCPKS